MAQAQYNLTDNVKPDFTFQIGELNYRFRYPTTAEIRSLTALNEELQELADKKADQKLIDAKAKETEAKMDELVTPEGHDNAINAVLETQPIPVVKNFRSMMAKEINLG